MHNNLPSFNTRHLLEYCLCYIEFFDQSLRTTENVCIDSADTHLFKVCIAAIDTNTTIEERLSAP